MFREIGTVSTGAVAACLRLMATTTVPSFSFFKGLFEELFWDAPNSSWIHLLAIDERGNMRTMYSAEE